MTQITMQQIAEKAGISRHTVSRVLNNKKVPVREGTREKILRIARELNFRPNVMAQALRTGRTSMIGITTMGENTGQFNFVYPGQVYKGIMDVCSASNYGIIFHDFPEITGPKQYRGLVESRRVDGLIFLLFSHNFDLFTQDDIRQLNSFTIPFIVIHSLGSTPQFPFVGVDTRQGGYVGTQHLIEHGYKRIACVKTGVEYRHWAELTGGYKRAVNQAGIKEEYVTANNWNVPAGYDLADSLLAGRAKLPDAFFTIDESLAHGMIIRFREAGLKVPGDLAFVGFGDTLDELTRITGLTLVCQPAMEKGRKAAEMLLERIDKKSEAGSYTFEAELKVNRSCGC